MNILWGSDLHLNFLNDPSLLKFITSLSAFNSDGLVITGDIGNGRSINKYLKAFDVLGIPVYFVLGNHDFYGSDFDFVLSLICTTVRDSKNLVYLTDQDAPIMLTENTALVGVDGWADGRYGDWERSDVELNDYTSIASFMGLSKKDRLMLMQKLAKGYADKLYQLLQRIIPSTKTVIIATHVPPFLDACIHLGKVSDYDWLPHFSSKVLGETVVWHAKQHPTVEFLVLCGHTHSEGQCQVAPNVFVSTANAVYYKPTVYRELHID